MIRSLRSRWLALGAAAVTSLAGAAASAQARSDEGGEPSHDAPKDVRRELPIAAFSYAASGVTKSAVGGQGFAVGLFAPDQSSTLGGGAMVWGAPHARLTLVGDAQRNVYGNFSPSLAAVVPLLGERNEGWALGGLAKFKIDGFASGPERDEVESELEVGALISFVNAGYRLDVNAIGGRGLGDDGETDAEMRLRFGRELGTLVWLGLDGQARLRATGPRALPNGRSWDFASGGQLLLGSGSFFAIATAGPSTMGLLSRQLGFTSMLGVGGTT